MKPRVLVTGGSTGIGASIVRKLASTGYDVDFLYNRSVAPAEELVAELRGLDGGSARAFQCDLSDPAQVLRCCERIEQQDEPYYGFVHNAGTTADSLAATIQQDKAQELMQVNFWSFTQLVKTLVRPMQRAKEGRIIAMSSLAASRGSRGNAVYAASKAALEAFCRCLVDEVSRKGITVNCVAPGFIDTRMVDIHFLDSSKDALARRIPAKRYGDVAEVAAAVAFLLDRETRYMNGATLVLDGGLAATVGLL